MTIVRKKAHNNQSPIVVATDVMRFRNSGENLTTEFCNSVLEKSDNTSVTYKLLNLIEFHLNKNPNDIEAYAEVLGNIWYRSIKNKRNMELLAKLVSEAVPEEASNRDTIALVSLLVKTPDLPKEIQDKLVQKHANMQPLTSEEKKDLEREVLLNKVEQGAYSDIVTEIIPQAIKDTTYLYEIQKVLSEQNKLEFDKRYGEEWNYCALGLKRGANLSNEEYQAIVNISSNIRKKYPQSLLTEIESQIITRGFADEKRKRVMENVDLLEAYPKDFPYLQNPELCYNVLSKTSIFLASGAVNRQQMMNDGIEREFSRIFSRLLHIYNQDKQVLDEEKNPTLAVLLESQCGRKMQQIDFSETYKEQSSDLIQDDLIALTYPYALKKGVLEDVLIDKMHVNVFQIEKRPQEYLPHIKTAKGMYSFLKGFRVHNDEEEIIDRFPELALEDISKPHKYNQDNTVKDETEKFLQTVDINMSIVNKSCEEDKSLKDKKLLNLFTATLIGLVDKYNELQKRQEEQYAGDIYERILIFCADKDHQISGSDEFYNSTYLQTISVARPPKIAELPFKSPEECAKLLETFRTERTEHIQQETERKKQPEQMKDQNLFQKIKSRIFSR